MIANIKDLDLSYLDKKRTREIQMWNRVFLMMLKDKEFETISIKSWANIPRSKHLIKEYKMYKKENEKNQRVING
ncbi:MAG: hypothetical protein JEZ08_16365 [Clostridiales bacterium]|nr:hypothetical protein [Clostridiales bacterium]